jgi:hypothetical protein
MLKTARMVAPLWILLNHGVISPRQRTLMASHRAASRPPLALSPQSQKQKTQEALVAWLLAETARQPVLAV